MLAPDGKRIAKIGFRLLADLPPEEYERLLRSLNGGWWRERGAHLPGDRALSAAAFALQAPIGGRSAEGGMAAGSPPLDRHRAGAYSLKVVTLGGVSMALLAQQQRTITHRISPPTPPGRWRFSMPSNESIARFLGASLGGALLGSAIAPVGALVGALVGVGVVTFHACHAH